MSHISQKLITFKDKLEYHGSFNDNQKIGKSKVISIIGESRNGKSTFMNCLISVFTKQHIQPFDFKRYTIKDTSDCTNGIDYYTYKDYVFLDVQGIGGTYSASDPSILLYVYYVSHIIILNINKQLNTNGISLLAPIATYATHFHNLNKKPQLVFRVFDCIDDYDDELARQNYDDVMTRRPDQIDGIRQALHDLFETSRNSVVWTERPDKKSLRQLEKSYLDSDLMFQESIDRIITRMNQLEPLAVDFSNVELVNKINVLAGNFDTTAKITNDDITLWINGDLYNKSENVPDELKTSIEGLTGSDQDDAIIQNRIVKVQDVLSKYNYRFEKSPTDIRNQGRTYLEELIMGYVNKGIQTSKELGFKMLLNEYKHIDETYDLFEDCIVLMKPNLAVSEYALNEWEKYSKMNNEKITDELIKKRTIFGLDLEKEVNRKIKSIKSFNIYQIDQLELGYDDIIQNVKKELTDEISLKHFRYKITPSFTIEYLPYQKTIKVLKVTKAYNELFQKLESERSAWQEFRSMTLAKYIKQYDNYQEQKDYYLKIKKHNKVEMITAAIPGDETYEFVVKYGKPHKIYTTDQFKKEVPDIVQKYWTRIIKGEHCLIPHMFRRWLEFIVES